VTLANSGLPYPLHYRAATARCEPIVLPGLPLGAFEAATYDERVVALEPGDIIVFHTDGVSEARAHSEDYGLARIRRNVEEHAGGPAAVLGEAILADVRAFMGDTARGDDLTLLVVKVR
jgi:sigma-B regulation protein RsbU (phosphoserine phosphatase)